MWPYRFTSVIFIALAIPLILRRIPPNRWYGFRTRKTRSNDRIWYEANRIAGWDLLWAGVAVFVLSFYVGERNPFVILGPVVVAIAHSFWALRRL